MSDLMTELCDFVRLMDHVTKKPSPDWMYSSPYDFLLRHGQEFHSADLPADGMEVILKAVGRRRLPVKECFSNSADVVFADKSGRLAYCEGFAARLLPVHHAWVILDGSIVVDLTWNRAGSKLHASTIKTKIVARYDDCAYFGVVFSRDRLAKQLTETQHYDSLLMDFRRGYPLLRENFDAAKEGGR